MNNEHAESPSSPPTSPTSTRSAISGSSWARETLAILRKDTLQEWRSRQGLTSAVLMAVVTVVALGFASLGQNLNEGLQAGLLWVALLFGMSGALARGFLVEEETGTADLLRVGATPSAVYAGKWLFHGSLFLVLSAIILPLHALFLKPDAVSALGLGLMWSAGGLSLVSALTFCGALVARTAVKGALLAALAFPVLLPMMLMAVSGTKTAFEGESVWGALQGLWGYGLMLTAGGPWIFERFWRE